jgi:flagellar hook-basal body complex protein FliE
MIGGIGKGDGLARAAIESALKRQAESLQKMQDQAASMADPNAASSAGTPGTRGAAFEGALSEGLGAIDRHSKNVERIHVDLLEGKLDVHEVAARLQQSKLAFDFAMQVRDRFVDAYREVMRMNV